MPDKMPDPQTYLQAMYKEQCDQARQHENMRQQSMTLVLAVSAALATVGGTALAATVQPLLSVGAPWVLALYALLGWVVMELARLGKALSLKHYERNMLHVARARQYRQRLIDLFPNTDYGSVNDDADKCHKAEWKLDSSIIEARLHEYWLGIYTFVRYLGIALIVIPVALAIVLTLVDLIEAQPEASTVAESGWVAPARTPRGQTRDE
jgi:hypothetical protein